MFTVPKKGIVNVKMVITEEKILSNIEKIQRMINPNSKKQIIELDDNSYFKDLVESVKTYLIEYPRKKYFPKSVYDAAYNLVEYATSQFEESTSYVEELIRQKEYNIKLATILKQTVAIVQNPTSDWQKAVGNVQSRYSADIIEALKLVGEHRQDATKSEEYTAALKLLNARVANLETNLHIEIDMERIEDRSKALSYIGLEIADALKLIPPPADTTNTTLEDDIQEASMLSSLMPNLSANVVSPFNAFEDEPVNQIVNSDNDFNMGAKPNTNMILNNSNMSENILKAKGFEINKNNTNATSLNMNSANVNSLNANPTNMNSMNASSLNMNSTAVNSVNTNSTNMNSNFNMSGTMKLNAALNSSMNQNKNQNAQQKPITSYPQQLNAQRYPQMNTARAQQAYAVRYNNQTAQPQQQRRLFGANNYQNNHNVVIDVPDKQPTKPVAYENYYADTRREVKESLWTKIKNSKLGRAISYIFRVRVVLQLPEGATEINNNR